MKPRFARGQAVDRAHVYVPRDEDDIFRRLSLGSSWFAVRGCRTMGKTSLIIHHLPWIERQEGSQVAFLDMGGWPLGSLEEWLLEFGRNLQLDFRDRGRSLDPEEAVSDLPRFLRRTTEDVRHTLIVLDEVDWLRELDYGREVFARLRAAQTLLARNDWNEGLAFCFVSLSSLSDIAGPQAAPIVKTLQMSDFPCTGSGSDFVVRKLAESFPDSIEARDSVARLILEQSGGQPFQTMILAAEVLDREAATVEAAEKAIAAYVAEQRDQPKELFSQMEEMLLEDPFNAQEALNTYENLLRRQTAPVGTTGAEILLRIGLVRARNGRLESKGPVFEGVFDEAWTQRMRDRLLNEYRKRRPNWRPWSRENRRICILNTGGTVGMVRRDGKVVEPRDERDFLDNYKELLELADIDFEQPFVRDSINVYPEQWSQIAETIYRKRNVGYTGFVVAHGTDTLAFSASAVAFALGQNLGFPVVFTGAQTTPDVLHGDSHANLLRACLVALQGYELPEVVICFGTRVFRAVRAQKQDERRFEGFDSPAFPPLGEITENILLNKERFLRKDLTREPPPESADIQLEAWFSRGVLMIQLTPGLEPEFYKPALEQFDPITGRRLCTGMILQTLGAGNVANFAPYSFTGFVREVIEAGIPVLITSPYPWSSDLANNFGPAAEPPQLGALAAGEMTAAAAAAKFRWAIAKVDRQIERGEIGASQRLDEIRKIMERNYLGEKDGPFWSPAENRPVGSSSLSTAPQEVPS